MTTKSSTSSDVDSSPSEIALTEHLATLASEASGLSKLLHAHHEASGDIRPETLAKAAKLETSLHDVIHALTHHDHLAMGTDDVWKALNVKHQNREINPD